MIYSQFTVKIPAEAHPQRNGRVQEFFPVEGKRRIRREVGQVAGEGVMNPSGLYFHLHPQEWKEQYPDQAAMLHCSALKVGLFALVLGIAVKLGIYQILCTVYGPDIANGIMDYVMYLLCTSSAETCGFESKMNDHLLFSVMPRDVSWYSQLWSREMTESQNRIVRENWLKVCMANGIRDVYLSIDGMNMDADAGLSEPEQDKPEADRPIAACMWAVCASGPYRGLPLTYFMSDGNIVDSKSAVKAVAFLSECDLNVPAILADKGFCTQKVMDHMKENGFDFVILLKEDTFGFETMLTQYGRQIPYNMKYSLKGGHRYGTAERMPVLQTTGFESYVALIYDTVSGALQKDSYLSDAYRYHDEWNEALKTGRKTAKIPEEYSDAVRIDPETKLAYLETEVLQRTIDRTGFYGFGTTLNGSASELEAMWRSRDSAEAAFAQLSGFPEFKTVRSEPSVLNLLLVGMVAAAIRAELENSCKRNSLSTKEILNEAAQYRYDFIGSKYAYSAAPSEKLLRVFADYDISENSLQSLQSLANLRYQAEEGCEYPQKQRSVPGNRRRRQKAKGALLNCEDSKGTPDGEDADGVEVTGTERSDGEIESHLTQNPDLLHGAPPADNPEPAATPGGDGSDLAKDVPSPAPGKKRGRKPKPKSAEEKPKGPGRGRVKGSKNKKTLERERLLAEGLLQLPPRKPRGRPRKPENILADAVWLRARAIAQARGLALPEKREKGRPRKWVTDILEEARTQLNQEATDPPS